MQGGVPPLRDAFGVYRTYSRSEYAMLVRDTTAGATNDGNGDVDQRHELARALVREACAEAAAPFLAPTVHVIRRRLADCKPGRSVRVPAHLLVEVGERQHRGRVLVACVARDEATGAVRFYVVGVFDASMCGKATIFLDEGERVQAASACANNPVYIIPFAGLCPLPATSPSFTPLKLTYYDADDADVAPCSSAIVFALDRLPARTTTVAYKRLRHWVRLRAEALVDVSARTRHDDAIAYGTRDGADIERVVVALLLCATALVDAHERYIELECAWLASRALVTATDLDAMRADMRVYARAAAATHADTVLAENIYSIMQMAVHALAAPPDP